MDNDRLTSYLIAGGVGVALLAFAALGFLFGEKHALKLNSTAIKVDSVVVIQRDTITREKPIYLTKYVDRIQLVPVRDSVTIRDTLFVALDRERVEWRDEYAAVWASGIDPAVDSVQHFITEKVITKEVRVEVPSPQRWKRIGWGVAAGPGVFWQPGMDNVTPGVGVVVGLRVNL